MKMSKLQRHTKEFVFQALVLTVLFVIKSFDRHSSFSLSQVVFFTFYASLAFVINYLLIPRFLYKKKYLLFSFILLALFIVAYLVEELILEKLFFNDERAEHVSNVFYTLLDILPIVLVMVGFKFAWDALHKQQQVESLQSNIKESELRFLKSQINPHFLFNNLNNLYSYAIEQSSKTPSIILELSSVLRYMLYDCKEDFVPLSKEIEHLKHFTALNELQVENRGSVSFNSEVTSDNFVVAPLILNVFIENAFKHSTASQSSDITIDIKITVDEDGLLNFSCTNSFLDVANNQNLSRGIGLDNVKKRLKLLYPNCHTLTINTGNNQYEVALSLQLKTKK